MLRVSVCIPCFQRPHLVKEAIQSALNQSVKPLEILIGDDSPDNQTQDVVTSIQSNDVDIRYFRNNPSLGQSKNVQQLFAKSRGDLITLIHDDDRYRANAFELLAKPFSKYPTLLASFGKQVVISENGVEDWMKSSKLNASYNRVDEASGLVSNTIEASSIGMFPNNGYFIRRKYIEEIDYHNNGQASTACDYVFGLNLGLLQLPFYFIDEYVCDYRITSTSVSRSTSACDGAFYSLKSLFSQISSEWYTEKVNAFIKEKIKAAIAAGIDIDREQCWQWYFSKWHRQHIFSLGGIHRFLMLTRTSS